MPNMANITIKKADGTTDITYTAMNPAGSDGTRALWRANTVGANPAQRPYYEYTAKANKDGTRRETTSNFVYPVVVVNAVTGISSVAGYYTEVVTRKLTLSASDMDAAEAVAQAANLSASALIKSCSAVGFGPT